MEILQMPCVGSSRVETLLGCSWEALVSRSCKIPSSSSRSFFLTILWTSFRGPDARMLVKVLYHSLQEDLVKIVVNPLRCPCMILSTSCQKKEPSSQNPCMLLYRSLWEDLVGILVKSSKRSWHDLVQALVKRSGGDPVEILLNPFEGPFRWSIEILLGVLACGSGMRSWWLDWRCFLYATTSSCCCSCDNVWPDLLLLHSYCCLYLAHWFPTPTLFGLASAITLHFSWRVQLWKSSMCSCSPLATLCMSDRIIVVECEYWYRAPLAQPSRHFVRVRSL